MSHYRRTTQNTAGHRRRTAGKLGRCKLGLGKLGLGELGRGIPSVLYINLHVVYSGAFNRCNVLKHFVFFVCFSGWKTLLIVKEWLRVLRCWVSIKLFYLGLFALLLVAAWAVNSSKSLYVLRSTVVSFVTNQYFRAAKPSNLYITNF